MIHYGLWSDRCVLNVSVWMKSSFILISMYLMRQLSWINAILMSYSVIKSIKADFCLEYKFELKFILKSHATIVFVLGKSLYTILNISSTFSVFYFNPDYTNFKILFSLLSDSKLHISFKPIVLYLLLNISRMLSLHHVFQ